MKNKKFAAIKKLKDEKDKKKDIIIKDLKKAGVFPKEESTKKPSKLQYKKPKQNYENQLNPDLDEFADSQIAAGDQNMPNEFSDELVEGDQGAFEIEDGEL